MYCFRNSWLSVVNLLDEGFLFLFVHSFVDTWDLTFQLEPPRRVLVLDALINAGMADLWTWLFQVSVVLGYCFVISCMMLVRRTINRTWKRDWRTSVGCQRRHGRYDAAVRGRATTNDRRCSGETRRIRRPLLRSTRFGYCRFFDELELTLTVFANDTLSEILKEVASAQWDRVTDSVRLFCALLHSTWPHVDAGRGGRIRGLWNQSEDFTDRHLLSLLPLFLHRWHDSQLKLKIHESCDQCDAIIIIFDSGNAKKGLVTYMIEKLRNEVLGWSTSCTCKNSFTSYLQCCFTKEVLRSGSCDINNYTPFAQVDFFTN